MSLYIAYFPIRKSLPAIYRGRIPLFIRFKYDSVRAIHCNFHFDSITHGSVLQKRS